MKGVFTALLTPFDESGRINEPVLRQMVRHNLDTMKVDGLYVGGSTGEAFLMRKEERIRALEIVKDEARTCGTLIAQVGALNVDEAIEIGLAAKALGYDAVSAITPYYYHFSFEEVYGYYKALCAAIAHPMIIYSNSSMAGGALSIERFDQLLSIEHVIGVKYSEVDVAKFERLRRRFSDKLFYYGYDEIALVGFLLGADGVIGSTYTVTGRSVKHLQGLLEAGRVQEARALQNQLTDCIEMIVDNGLYPTLKGLMARAGIGASFMKKPFSNLSEAQAAQIPAIYEKIDALNAQNR